MRLRNSLKTVEKEVPHGLRLDDLTDDRHIVELRLLRYFLVVAEELHVGRAAKRLHMAQQPLSAAIRRLENAIGADLFVRNGNRFRLSAAGAGLVADGRDIVNRADAAAERARNANRGLAGTLRIGYCSAAMSTVIPALAALYRVRHPDVVLDLAQMAQREQLERLTRGDLDVAFVHRPQHVDNELGRASVEVTRDRLIVAMPISHPLASRESVAPNDVAAEIGASFRPEDFAEFLAVVDEAFATTVPKPKPTTFARDRASLLGLVAGGAGLAILTESAARAEARPDIALRILATPVLPVFVATWTLRQDIAPLLERFHDALLEVTTEV